MKIVIVGCGRFGSIITELMLNDGHDIVVVDSNEEYIENINNTFDVMAICGNGADYNLLSDIGMKDTDVCIACTASDELNLLISCLSKKMGAKHTIARFRSQTPGTKGFQFVKEQLELDLVVSPDYFTAKDALKIIEKDGCKEVIILGATRIAIYLTQMLIAHHIRVKVIDRDEANCTRLSNAVPSSAIVINSDESKHDVVEAAGIRDADALVAITSRDEENILAALSANGYGISTVITKFEKPAYFDIVKNLDLEHVISPRTSTAYFIQDYIRGLK